MELNPGQVFADHYRIERVVSEGPPETVYAARSDRLGRQVALSVFEPGAVGDAAAAERVVAGARRAGQLQVPGVIGLLDGGVRDGAPWLAMELIDGETLAQRAKWGRRVDASEAVRIADQLLETLGATHASGLVHGDLNPTNVILERGTERVRVRGFGLAQAAASGTMTGQTATVGAMGTPAYVAPECATDASAISPATDLYGVGAILFELLSGDRPYAATTLGELVQQMHHHGARPLLQVAPQAPPALAGVVDQLLRVDPSARYGSAAEVRAALTSALSQAPPGAGAGAFGSPASSSGSAPGTPATMALDSSQLQQALSAPGVGPSPFGSPPAHAGAVTPPLGGVSTQGMTNPPAPAGFGHAPGAPPPGGPPHSPAGFGSPPQGPTPYAAPAAPASSGSGTGAIIAIVAVGAVVLGLVFLVVVGAGAGVWFTLSRAEVEPPPPLPEPSPIVSVAALGMPGSSEERVRISTDDAPALGGAEPLVTIVTFSDFQCPFCARVDPTMAQVRQTYGDRVRYVWRDNPLPFHQQAMPAAELAREAYVQGGDDAFWRVHGLLFENQRALQRADLERYAQTGGLDLSRVRSALDSQRHQPSIRADMQAAATANARGTPAFFINGRHVRGAQPFAEFQRVVDEEIALANALLARGVQRRDLYETFQREAVTSPAPEPTPAPTPQPGRDPNAHYEIPIPARAPSWGSANAPVTIQLFSDFQCPFCSRVQPTLAQIRETYPGRVRIVWRNYPLPFHQRAMPAAIAAMEVYEQAGDEAFWRYHDLLFENQRALEDEDLVRYASQVSGVRPAGVRAALASQRHQARVRSDMTAVQESGARIGTPSFFINGRLLSGAQPFPAFRERIDEELSRPR